MLSSGCPLVRLFYTTTIIVIKHVIVIIVPSENNVIAWYAKTGAAEFTTNMCACYCRRTVVIRWRHYATFCRIAYMYHVLHCMQCNSRCVWPSVYLIVKLAHGVIVKASKRIELICAERRYTWPNLHFVVNWSGSSRIRTSDFPETVGLPRIRTLLFLSSHYRYCQHGAISRRTAITTI